MVIKYVRTINLPVFKNYMSTNCQSVILDIHCGGLLCLYPGFSRSLQLLSELNSLLFTQLCHSNVFYLEIYVAHDIMIANLVCVLAILTLYRFGTIHILYNAKRGRRGLAMCYICYMRGGGGLDWRYIT